MTAPPTAAAALARRLLTEDQLGECVRDACKKLGWRFLWLRKTYNSSAGILDLLLIPETHLERRHVLFRELKGFDARGRLGRLTIDQVETIRGLRANGEDADMWAPEQWWDGTIDAALAPTTPDATPAPSDATQQPDVPSAPGRGRRA